MLADSSLRRRLSNVLNPHQKMSGPGFVVDLVLAILIVLNVIAFVLESVEAFNISYSRLFDVFEAVSVILFTIEYLARLWSAPDRDDLPGKTATAKRLRYVFSVMGFVDLLVIIPFWLRWFVLIVDLRWLRILRLFWLFKLSHFTPAMELVAEAAYKERNAIASTLYLLLIVITISGTMVYLAERNAQPEVFQSIPESMYWAIMTLTPGNSNAIPITFLGRIVGMATALLGVCTFALLTGILSTSFYHQLQQRKQVLNARIQDYLKKGKISEEERSQIEKLIKQLHLSDEHSLEIIQLLTELKADKKSSSPS